MKIEKNGVVLTIDREDYPISPREDCNWLGTMICFHNRYGLGDDHDYTSPEDFLQSVVWNNTDSGLAEYVIDGLKNGRWEGLGLKESNGIYSYMVDGECYNTFTHSDICYVVDYVIEDLSLDALLELAKERVVILPLYLYDHSSLTMSTSPLHCSWDSGQVGWIYCSKERFLKETRHSEEELFEQGKAVEILESEVEVYDQYLRGDIYGFTLEKKTTCPYCNAVEFEEIDSCSGFYGDDFAENGLADALGEFAYMINFCKLITV